MAMGSDALAAFRGLSPDDWQWLERMLVRDGSLQSEAWSHALDTAKAALDEETLARRTSVYNDPAIVYSAMQQKR
jgi:hypothetical protein